MQNSYHILGTTRTSGVGQKQWIRFCDHVNIPDRAYNEDNLMRFLIWLDTTIPGGIEGQSAKNKVYAVKEYAALTYGDIIQIHQEAAPRLTRLRRILNQKKPPTDGSDPSLIEDCIAMIQQIQKAPITEWEKQTQQTLISFAFGEIKRANEYVTTKDDKRPLKHGDLQETTDPITKQKYEICTRIKRKTHQNINAPNGPHQCARHVTSKN